MVPAAVLWKHDVLQYRKQNHKEGGNIYDKHNNIT